MILLPTPGQSLRQTHVIRHLTHRFAAGVVASLLALGITSSAWPDVIFSESFELPGPDYDSGSAGQATVTVSPSTFDGKAGVWDRSDGSNLLINEPSDPLTGFDGAYYWAAEFFHESPAGLTRHSITFDNIDISNHEALSVSVLLAAAGQGNIRFDPSDELTVTYRVDDDPIQAGLCLSTVGGVAAGNNEPIAHDPNCDGDGADGTVLSELFQPFGFSIPNGNTLSLTVTALVDGSDEELFFDKLQVNGTSRDGLLGDFDKNGSLNAVDIDQLTAQSAGGMHPPSFDLDGDKLVNETDIHFWVKDLLGSWIGDANVDGEFNSTDFLQVFQAGKFELDLTATWTHGDWTGDGRFDSSDLVSAFQDSGYDQGRRSAISVVPEPTSIVILMTGLMGIVIGRRCLRSSTALPPAT